MKLKFTILLLLFSFGHFANAQNVYNFYFEETSIGKVENTSNDAEAKIKSEDIVDESEVALSFENSNALSSSLESDLPVSDPLLGDSLSRWELGASLFFGFSGGEELLFDSTDDTYRDRHSNVDIDVRGISLSGAYRFYRYLSAEANLFLVSEYNSSILQSSYLSEKNSVNGSVGLAITPIHINLFGYSVLELSYVAGLVAYDYFSVNSDVRDDEPVDIESSKKFGVYQGAKIAVNLTPKFGLVASAVVSSDESSNSSLGLRYRF